MLRDRNMGPFRAGAWISDIAVPETPIWVANKWNVSRGTAANASSTRSPVMPRVNNLDPSARKRRRVFGPAG